MAKNKGKMFEEDFKKSVPEWAWCYRFKDGTANFNGSKNENVRFQAHNICDFQVMAYRTLFLFELKSHEGASIPFSCIRANQLEEMSAIYHPDIKAYFVFNFRDIQNTYAVLAADVKEFIETTDRKSIPIKWCIENGIEIKSEKKKVRFRYFLEEFLEGENK